MRGSKCISAAHLNDVCIIYHLYFKPLVEENACFVPTVSEEKIFTKQNKNCLPTQHSKKQTQKQVNQCVFSHYSLLVTNPEDVEGLVTYFSTVDKTVVSNAVLHSSTDRTLCLYDNWKVFL